MFLPKVPRLKPNTQFDSIWRWGLSKVIRTWGRALMNVWKRPQASSLLHLLCTEISSTAVYEPGSSPSPEVESWAPQPLDLRAIHFCCWSYPVYGNLLYQPKQTMAVFLWKLFDLEDSLKGYQGLPRNHWNKFWEPWL